MNPKSERALAELFRTDFVLTGQVLEKALSLGRLPAAGQLSAAQLPRLRQDVASLPAPVTWEFSPDPQAPGPGRWRRRWWLSVGAELVCTCERCLTPVTLTISARRGFEFFESAAQADAHSERLDDEELDSDPQADLVDYLSPEDGMTIATLVEDEILLAMPMAPKHERCDMPLPLLDAVPGGQETGLPAAGAAGDAPETIRPFLGLKDLLKKR